MGHHKTHNTVTTMTRLSPIALGIFVAHAAAHYGAYVFPMNRALVDATEATRIYHKGVMAKPWCSLAVFSDPL